MNDPDPLSILAVFGTAETAGFEVLPSDGIKTILALLILFFVNAVLVAGEFALIRTRESQLSAESDDSAATRHRLARAKKLIRHADRYVSVCQIGTTICSLAIGMTVIPFSASWIYPLWSELFRTSPLVNVVCSLVLGFSVIGAAHIVIVKLIPKFLALRYSVGFTLALAPMLIVLKRLFYYSGIWGISRGLENIVMKYFLGMSSEHAGLPGHSTDELVHLVEESERSQELTRQEAEISKNALELNDMCVKDVMTPRSDVDVMDVTAPFDQNWALARESRHTRFPLVEGTHLDEVKGWVHVKDLLKLVGKDHPDLMSVRREMKLVPDTMPLDDLLTYFLKEHAHFALVVDEFGDSIGLVFLDDVLEQIIGDDIQDEFDLEEAPEFISAGEGRYATTGALTLVDLADYLPELDLECPGVTTLGGYVISRLGHIPEVGEELTIGDYLVTVTGSDGRKITHLSLMKMNPTEKDPA